MSKRVLYICAGLMLLNLFLVPALVGAAGFDPGLNFIRNANLGAERDPREMAMDIIKLILGFLGIIALVLILLGGFKWMLAAGNEEKVEEAKKLLWAGLIGLILILAAFAISNFVISSLMNVTTRY